MDANFPELSQQNAVIDVVKTAFDIAFQREYRFVFRFRGRVQGVTDVGYRVFLRPVRPESVTVRIKSRLTDGFYDNADTLLNNSVQYGRNSQRRIHLIAVRL